MYEIVDKKHFKKVYQSKGRHAIVFHPTQSNIVAVSHNADILIYDILIYDIIAGKLLFPIINTDNMGTIMYLEYNRLGTILLTFDCFGKVCLVAVDSGTILTTINVGTGCRKYGVKFWNDDQEIITCSFTGFLKVYSVHTGQEIKSINIGCGARGLVYQSIIPWNNMKTLRSISIERAKLNLTALRGEVVRFSKIPSHIQSEILSVCRDPWQISVYRNPGKIASFLVGCLFLFKIIYYH